MKEIYSDISIIGGGLIGVFAAYSLSKIGFSITVVEKKQPYNEKINMDFRTVAISEGTKVFLEKINLWKDINKFAEKIKKIKVIDRQLSNNLQFDNSRRNSNLGYIVKNKDLLNIVYKNLRSQKNVTIYNNVSINNFYTQDDLINIECDELSIKSSLNIAADGKNSFVRAFHKTPFFIKNYKKSALVVTFTHNENHQNTAFEFFYKNGPLAILPMRASNDDFTSSIIWTNKTKYLNEISKLDNDMLMALLFKETQHAVGNIKKIITKQIFPLSAHLNTKFYHDRTIYIGDAAHSFHPIAGQGWNLGMKDIENLNKLVTKYKSLGIDLGNKFFCKEYHNDNFYNAYRLYQVTDKLDSIFKNQNPLISFGRSFALSYLEKNKKINNLISDFAMGIN
tara:strand:- start:733 stop:1914 length:1182 start_codon:yes stop_codon:yes gene_type:complete